MSTDPHSIYQFSVLDEFGKTVSMDKYKGKVVVIVNVASNCGYTKPNYTGLKLLSDQYKSQGLEVACFPCNQFKQQEPGTEAEIRKFIKDNYNFEPDLYKKIDVNGEHESPLYTFLKKEQGDSIVDALKTMSLPSSDIKWNFTKFVCNRQGHPISRYPPAANPAR
uniref:Glutathione peroxidase n=1 Tax=Ditylenchus dipsaci TaxID=166011 RepID=A0A915DE03_9BILA